jgi:hypothetical protein
VNIFLGTAARIYLPRYYLTDLSPLRQKAEAIYGNIVAIVKNEGCIYKNFQTNPRQGSFSQFGGNHDYALTARESTSWKTG